MTEHAHFEAREARHYSSQVTRTLGRILVLNWFVALLKLVFGYWINSTSMVADGYHSLADGSSNIIGLLGMRLASQPVDQDHPYGHKKYETFASLFIGFLLLLICFHILHDSWERLWLKTAPRIDFWSFAVLGLTIAVNAGVMIYERKKGEELGSDILIADATHTRADIMTSASVIIAFIGVRLGFPVLDSIAAFLIVIFIGMSGVAILRSTSEVLCDTAVLGEGEVERIVLKVPGVKKCHRVRTRGRRDDVHLDLHVLVEDHVPVVRAHQVSSDIEKKLKAEFRGVTDVVVHVEPLSSEKDAHD